jgi:hypothetical protein
MLDTPGTLFAAFLGLIALVFMPAVVVKLSARAYRRTKLSWRHACGYTVLIFGVYFVLGAVHTLGGSRSPSSLAMLIGAFLVCHLLVGGWYLGSKATDSTGAAITFPRGAILGAIVFGILSFILFLPAFVFSVSR